MSLRDRNYWIEQTKEKILANSKASDSYEKELIFLYDEAANQIETEITSMYAKYAKDNELTNAEASKLLSGKEHSQWKKSIQEYIEDIAKAGKGSRTLLELNTLSAKSQISRKEQLLANIYQNMMTLANDSNTKLSELLGDLFETNYYRNCYNVQQGIGIGFNVQKINEKRLKQVLEFPWSRKTFSQTLWENTDKLAALTKREITLGFINGSSVQKMAKEVNDIMGKGTMAATRLVRTECSYFANQGEMISYQEMGIEEYEFLGAGCEDCQALNGLKFKVSEAVAGINLPPIHPNCKCTTKSVHKIDMFKLKPDANPLASNVKFQEWKEKYIKQTEEKK